MVPFAGDADLLIYEPRVFVELPFVRQQTFRVEDGVLSSDTVSSVTGGMSDLAVGDVLVIQVAADDETTQVIAEIIDDNSVRLEERVTSLSVNIGLVVMKRTLEPQIEAVHRELMKNISIDLDDPNEELDESAILSQHMMRRLTCFGALWQAYRAGMGSESALAEKAYYYERRFRRAMSGASVLIDTNGDGSPNDVRYTGVGCLLRM